MILYFQQIEELLEIIDKNQLVAGTDLGPDFVTEEDKVILLKYGVNFSKLYVKESNTVFKPFNFGMLTVSLKAFEENTFTYEQLKAFIIKGNYIPISERERTINENLSNQPYKELLVYSCHDIMKHEIIEGFRKHLTPTKIASNIGHKTGHWGLDELIKYYQDLAWNEAKISEIKKTSAGGNPIVYKLVSKCGCCEHCSRLYLTNGAGSQPKLFKMSELEKNGSNESRLPVEWKATLSLTHKNCSCMLYEYSDAYLWNEDQQSFSTPDPNYERRKELKRKLIRVLINGKEHFI